MTTNKPEVVAWYTPPTRDTLPVVALNDRSKRGEPLIRLSDYEALQAECEKLRTLLAAAPDVQGDHAAEISNDKMRDEFDSWIEQQGMSTMKDGETYYHRVTHVAWQAWKASRAALNIAVQMEVVGWQFYEDGKWWNGDDRIKDHKRNTQEAGYRIRDVYAITGQS